MMHRTCSYRISLVGTRNRWNRITCPRAHYQGAQRREKRRRVARLHAAGHHTINTESLRHCLTIKDGDPHHPPSIHSLHCPHNPREVILNHHRHSCGRSPSKPTGTHRDAISVPHSPPPLLPPQPPSRSIKLSKGSVTRPPCDGYGPRKPKAVEVRRPAFLISSKDFPCFPAFLLL